MKTYRIAKVFLIAILIALYPLTKAVAQEVQTPSDQQPEQAIMARRAVEAAIWGMPLSTEMPTPVKTTSEHPIEP